jgi:hypothetical protein
LQPPIAATNFCSSGRDHHWALALLYISLLPFVDIFSACMLPKNVVVAAGDPAGLLFCYYRCCYVSFWPSGSRRPPLIILDELDGAAGGAEGHSAVAALVKLVAGEAASGRCRQAFTCPHTKHQLNSTRALSHMSAPVSGGEQHSWPPP